MTSFRYLQLILNLGAAISLAVFASNWFDIESLSSWIRYHGDAIEFIQAMASVLVWKNVIFIFPAFLIGHCLVYVIRSKHQRNKAYFSKLYFKNILKRYWVLYNILSWLLIAFVISIFLMPEPTAEKIILFLFAH